MSRYRSQGLLAVGIGLAAAACGDPELNTDLRPAGPPDVLAVMSQSSQAFALFDRYPEQPFYCKYVGGKRDDKAPSFVGDPITGGTVMCPEDEADFHKATLDPMMPDDVPFGVRVMFDELLNADLVETLECDDNNICTGSIADTNPVGITCGPDHTEVPYTGYYVPNGNRVTYPVGPSIYFQPDPAAMTFPTGTTCTFTVDPSRVQDKDGEAVPSGDTTFSTQIADLELLWIDPAEGDDATISPDPAAAGAAAFVFNANLDFDPDWQSVLDPDMFLLQDGDGNDLPTWTYVGAYNYPGYTDAVYVFPDTATGIFTPGDYSASMLPGEMQEINGGTLTVSTAETTHFSVAFDKTGQTSGSDFGAASFMRVYYNNTLDESSLSTDDVELFSTTTTPANAQIPIAVSRGNATSAYANTPNNSMYVTPDAELPLGTYALRIKRGAEIKDVDGNTKTYGSPVAITYNVLLKVTGVSPANNSDTAAPSDDVKIVFSGSLDPASVQDTEFELVDLTTMDTVAAAISVGTTNQAHPNDTVIINPNANLVAGRSYRFTMKGGTSLTHPGETKFGATFNPVTRSFANPTNWTFTVATP